MSRRMTFEVQELLSQTSLVTLSGIIDEDNRLAELGAHLDCSTLVLDAAGLERINSCGVRDWVNWIGDLERRDIAVIMLRCSPALVSQMTLVNNFLGHAAVVSFFAPYYCLECEKERLHLIVTREHLDSDDSGAPRVRCEGCDQVMDFDEDESAYFAFVRDLSLPALDEQLAREISSIHDRGLSVEVTSDRPVREPTSRPSRDTVPSVDFPGLLTEVSSVSMSSGSASSALPPGMFGSGAASGQPAIVYLIITLSVAALTLLYLLLATRL